MESAQAEPEQHQVIQLAAYSLWEQRGCPFGTPEIDWLRAEEQLREHSEHSSIKPALVAAAETVGSALGRAAGLVASIGS